MKMYNLAVAVSVGLLLTAAPLLAHHSPAAHFDMNDPVKVEGRIVKVEWANPHIWFYLDVEGDNGQVATWGFEGAPPGMLVRRAISRDSLEIGVMLRVEGFRARDGSNNATGDRVTFVDGGQVFVGTDGRGVIPQFSEPQGN